MTRLYVLLCIVVAAATLAASLILYPQMPEIIPTHWNIQGQIDGHGHKQRRKPRQGQRDGGSAGVCPLDMHALSRRGSHVGPDQVRMEKGWTDGGGNRPCSERACQQNQGLGHQQASGQALTPAFRLASFPFHVPWPMR